MIPFKGKTVGASLVASGLISTLWTAQSWAEGTVPEALEPHFAAPTPHSVWAVLVPNFVLVPEIVLLFKFPKSFVLSYFLEQFSQFQKLFLFLINSCQKSFSSFSITLTRWTELLMNMGFSLAWSQKGSAVYHCLKNWDFRFGGDIGDISLISSSYSQITQNNNKI